MNTNVKMSKSLALIILNAAKLHQDGYDKKAAARATKKAEADRKARPDDIYAGIVDYRQFHRKTLEQAAHEAAVNAGEREVGDIAYFLLANSWNDAMEWAQENNAD